ncbi:MAG: Nif3-like dinuclear metal center hexameric protein [Candidatus Magnetomorum sp.]|nr:Nif3-like dinuclear metal center hexameric protein [Candidatus Magnetomorum sp.]
MLITVNDIIGAMNTIAPSDLAESWDNIGLQVGDPKWTVRRVWMALDPLPEVIQSAIEQKIDLIITHHPLLFDRLSCVNLADPVGRTIADAIQHKIAIYAAHTNLDKVSHGINDILAKKLGMKEIHPIVPDATSTSVKLVLFVPQSYTQDILNALFEKNAGVIGQYSKCSFRVEGVGTFQPGKSASPFLGKKGQLEHIKECRIETIISLKDVPEIIRYVKEYHPYETMAYDIYSLKNAPSEQGIGRVGKLSEPMILKELADMINKTLDLSYVRMIGDPNLVIHRLAVCSGSGGSLLKNIFALGVQAYVTGDLKYHDARNIEAHQIGAIDVGHFETEHLFIDHIIPKLQNILDTRNWPVEVMPCPIEQSPFQITKNSDH